MAGNARYTPAQMLLHWATALLIVVAVAVAWVMMAMPFTSPWIVPTFQFHKSLGLTVWLLIVARLGLRVIRPAPGPLPGQPAAIAGAAHASHWLMYLVFFAMPVSGYVMSAAGGHGVGFWGLKLPDLPRDDALAGRAMALHLAGQWAVYALVVLHVAAAAWHVAVRRDGTLDRMLPPQRPLSGNDVRETIA